MRPICIIVLALLSAPLVRAQTFPTTQQLTADLAGPFSAKQANPTIISRGDISHRVEKILIQQARYLVSTLHPWPNDPRAALLTDGGSVEAQIRPNAHTAYGLAVLYRAAPDSAFTPDFTRQIAHDKAIALLRFLLPTHGAGNVKLKDGKLWHNQWQSALWAYSAGQAAWLMWDDLDPEMKWLAARMICDEADRFIDLKPPMQIISDTKAEENAWDSQIISLAYCMFPNHPNHARYREAAIRWIINSYPTQADTKRDDVIDGKPLKEWLVGANLHEDYTLENHDRVHPDYMSTTAMMMFQKLIFAWAGEKPPESLDWNVQKLYASSKVLCFPDGGYVYPNGQDWHLHRNADWFDYHCPIAVLYGDRDAARLMRIVLETAEKMAARDPNGSIVRKDETVFASTQHFILEGYGRSYLLLLSSGEGPEPVTEEQLWKSLEGLHVFESGKFALLRTSKSIATFSWGRQIMGMVLPMQKDLLLTPNERSLIGMIDEDVPVMRDVKLASIPGTLALCGIIERGKPRRPTSQPSPKIEQRFGFVSLPDGRTVYVDHLTQLNDTPPHDLKLGTLGVLNDAHWVYHDFGRRLYAAKKAEGLYPPDTSKNAPELFSSNWLNLDDCLGIGLLGDGDIAQYEPRPTKAPGRLEQLLHLNVMPPDALKHAKSGDTITSTALVFFPGQPKAQTSAAVARCKLSGDWLHPIVQLDDRIEIHFDLEKLNVSIEQK